jgi:hypothetical protein
MCQAGLRGQPAETRGIKDLTGMSPKQRCNLAQPFAARYTTIEWRPTLD